MSADYHESPELTIYKMREEIAKWQRMYLQVEADIEDLAQAYRKLGCGDVADKLTRLLPHVERP